MTIEYLLRRLVGGDDRFDAVVRFTLDKMADGGIHDQLGGGFHRYATDPVWLVPHFEQMLYDNAQLARVYLHAWAATGEARYRDVGTGTLDYMIRELTTADGAFAASQDADTEGIEGLTFVWAAAEIREVLGADADPFLAAYGVTDEGNWEGRTILSRVLAGRPHAAVARRRPTRSDARRGPHPAPGQTIGAPAAGSRRQGAGSLERAGDRRIRRRGAPPAPGRSRRRGTVSGGRGSGSGDDHRRPARERRRARALVEGRPGHRSGRVRGLHAPRGRPARPVRGDLRRALVHDRREP